jgi:HSP20 family molecular chaperone IbpA
VNSAISQFGTNIRFEDKSTSQKWIQINETGERLSTAERTKQVQHLTEIVQSDVVFECTETDHSYHLKVSFEGNIDHENLHVYLEDDAVVIETRNDSKGKSSLKTLECGDIPAKDRSILYIRRAITLPQDVEPSSISTQSIDDTVVIEMAKRVPPISSVASVG